MKVVARGALRNVSKVFPVEPWFAHRRSLELLKDEAWLKRRCGQVTLIWDGGATQGLCIPVVIALSWLARRGGGW